MGIFRSKKKADEPITLKACAAMIEEVLKTVGLNPNDQRMQNQNSPGWFVQRGSAMIYIFLIPDEKTPSVRFVSPILFLPEDFITPFYRRCLEINMELMNCALGVTNDKIALVSERPFTNLDVDQIVYLLHYISAVADDIDDKLAKEFKAAMYAQGLEPS
jgi:hypothetical protein